MDVFVHKNPECQWFVIVANLNIYKYNSIYSINSKYQHIYINNQFNILDIPSLFINLYLYIFKTKLLRFIVRIEGILLKNILYLLFEFSKFKFCYIFFFNSNANLDFVEQKKINNCKYKKL